MLGGHDLNLVINNSRLIDSLSLGKHFNDTTHHISSGETAILSFSAAESTGIASLSSPVDFFDILGTNVNTSSSSAHLESNREGTRNTAAESDQDLLDFLSPHSSSSAHCESILLELVVDSRKVSDKAAFAYLANIKDAIESKL